MTLDLPALQSIPRLLLEATLRPLQGDRFQPTGFADLGAARFTVPSADGQTSTEKLLVESAQSVANRTEAACWSEADDDLIPELRGLPYIVVQTLNGKKFTSSIEEAHRINSEYIMKSGGKPSGFHVQFAKEIEYAADAPVQWKKFTKALLKYDIFSLLHGCFLEEIGGRLRITRALSGFIEADAVEAAESGGVKNNRVQPELKGGEGNVPYSRTEFTARSITAYFNLDLALLRSYGLGEDAFRLLVASALFKVCRFLSDGLRLRTACDLTVTGPLRVSGPNGFAVPDAEALLAECAEARDRCAAAGLFAEPRVTVVKWEADKKKKDKASVDTDEDAGDEGELGLA